MDAVRILVTDLDGTLVGDTGALVRFAAWYAERGDQYRLVYATGRVRDSLWRLIEETDLPQPDAVISAVGTEIHAGDGRPWPGWTEQFRGWDADIVRRALDRFPWLTRQPDAAQSQLKASYDVQNLRASYRLGIQRALQEAAVDATIVYSLGLHLDVIPARAGKGKAARFVVDSWCVPGDRVLVFGDSGNDIELFQQGFRGTLVANAHPELSAAIGDDAYRSPFAYAAGVLDGIRYWAGI